MRYILVLQWLEATETSYDALIARESTLEAGLGAGYGFVDGHDLGSGEMNIFVHTDTPEAAFAEAARLLGADPGWVEVRAAFRAAEGDRYEVLWPHTLSEFSIK